MLPGQIWRRDGGARTCLGLRAQLGPQEGGSKEKEKQRDSRPAWEAGLAEGT